MSGGFEKLKTLFTTEKQRSQSLERQRFSLVLKWYYLRFELCVLCDSAGKKSGWFFKGLVVCIKHPSIFRLVQKRTVI